MLRVLVSPETVGNQTITIRDPSTLHHLTRVLRASVGDRIECVDGQGRRYLGAITRGDARHLSVTVASSAQDPPDPVRIVVAPALIKAGRFDWLIEKATELGAHRIQPLLTQRTAVRCSDASGEGKLARWRRIAREAAVQCGRATLPEVAAPQPFDVVVPAFAEASLILIPTLETDGASLPQIMASRPDAASIILLVGPEGDFTPEEVQQAMRRGAQPVSLGRLTLRSETAAIAGLAMLQPWLRRDAGCRR